MNILKRIGAWLAAVISVVLLGVIFQTQNIIARLGRDIYRYRFSYRLFGWRPALSFHQIWPRRNLSRRRRRSYFSHALCDEAGLFRCTYHRWC